MGRAVAAAVVLNPGASLDLAALTEALQGRIAAYKMPRRLIVGLEALPHTPTGKVMKHVLRDGFVDAPALQKQELVMPAYAPATHLETHAVTNQPAAYSPRNLYSTDAGFREGVRREAGDRLDAPLMARLGVARGLRASAGLGRAGQSSSRPNSRSSSTAMAGASTRPAFIPAYHELMALAMEHRIHDIALDPPTSRAATWGTWRAWRCSPRPKPA